MKISDLPPEERPRERMVKWGEEALSNRELLALLLATGWKGGSALEVADNLLSRFRNWEGLHRCTLRELQESVGVGVARACRIKGALEIGRRLVEFEGEDRLKIVGSREAVQALKPWFIGLEREKFMALALDAKKKLIQAIPISVGSLVSCPVHPREVFRPLIREGAVMAVVAHNHPSSGDPEPSQEDLDITWRLRKTGQMVGIPLVDHIIMGSDRYVSLAERGLMDEI